MTKTQARLLISEEKQLIEALTPEWQLQQVLRLFRIKRLEIARQQRVVGLGMTEEAK